MANETKKYETNDYLNNINWQLKRIADQLERLNNQIDNQDIFSHLGNTDKPPMDRVKSPEVQSPKLKAMLQGLKYDGQR